MNVNTKEAVKSISSLEKELQETNEQLKEVDVNSAAFTDLQKKAASVQGQLDKINQQTAVLSKGLQGFGENLAKTTAGISGGITAATAAMQLMGVENENVLDGIAKLQSLMAFTQGISGVKDLAEGMRGLGTVVKTATKSFTGLKGAIMATGIGALAVALGVIIENWDKIIAKVNEFVDVTKVSEKAVAGLAAAWAGLKQTIVAIGNAITQYITAPFRAITAAVREYTDTEGSVVDKLKAAMSASKDEIVSAGGSIVDGFKEIGTKAADAFSDSLQTQSQARATEAARAAIEAYSNAYWEAYKKEEERIQAEQMVSGWADSPTAQHAEMPDKPEVEREEEEDDGWADKVTKAQEYYAQIMELEQSEALAFEQAQQDKLNALNDALAQGLISEEQHAKAVKEIHKKSAQYQIQQSMSAASGVADILSSLASMMDENNEKQFKASKAMQIASATINMLVGITSAISGLFTTKSGPWDIALAAIQAASIAASGAANIAQISRTKYNGSTSSATASVSAASVASTVTPVTQYSQAVESANLESTIGDSRVYVVESDIAQTGNKVSVQESENRY